MAEELETQWYELLKWACAKGVTVTAVKRLTLGEGAVWTVTYSIPDNTMADVTVPDAPTRELNLKQEAVVLGLLQSRIEALDKLHAEAPSPRANLIESRSCNVCAWTGSLRVDEDDIHRELPPGQLWVCPKCGAEVVA